MIMLYPFLGLYILNKIVFVFVGVSMIFVLISIVLMISYTILAANKYGKLGAYKMVCKKFAVFIVCWILQMNVADVIMNYKARSEIRSELKRMDANLVTIKIDGNEIENGKEVFAALQGLEQVFRSRSRVINEVECEIVYNGKILHLLIGQQDVDRSQYWVYYPKHGMTGSNAIGGFDFEGNIVSQIK